MRRQTRKKHRGPNQYSFPRKARSSSSIAPKVTFDHRPGLGNWFSAHFIEMLFALLLISLLAGLFVLNHKTAQQNLAKAESLRGMLSAETLEHLTARYPQGYQLFFAEKGKLIPLEKEKKEDLFKVDWSAARAAQITRRHREQPEEFLKLSFPSISYNGQKLPPLDNIRLSLNQPGAASSLGLGPVRITLEVLTRTNEGVLCVLGLE